MQQAIDFQQESESLADALKYVFKEIIIPASANKIIFILAPIVTMTLALISWAVIPFSEDFATGMADVTLLDDNSTSSIDSSNNNNMTWHGQGGTYLGFITPSSGAVSFATNPTHIATMAMCVDLTAYAGQPVTVSFDLRQEFSFNGSYSYFRLADDSSNVLVDGNGNDYFSPATACSDAWANVSYDLSAYAGGVVNLMFQSCNKYNDDYYQCGDNAYVDNINISVQATPVYGCTDPLASNYDAGANTDDGSCCYDNSATLEMFDSYGDGQLGSAFGGVDGTTTITLDGTEVFTSTGDWGTSIGGNFGSGCVALPNDEQVGAEALVMTAFGTCTSVPGTNEGYLDMATGMTKTMDEWRRSYSLSRMSDTLVRGMPMSGGIPVMLRRV